MDFAAPGTPRTLEVCKTTEPAHRSHCAADLRQPLRTTPPTTSADLRQAHAADVPPAAHAPISDPPAVRSYDPPVSGASSPI